MLVDDVVVVLPPLDVMKGVGLTPRG